MPRHTALALLRSTCVIGVAALWFACGPQDDRPPPPDQDGSTGGQDTDGGTGGDGGSGADGSGGQTGDPGAPSVEVDSPEADAVLTSTLSAACIVVPDDATDANPVDPASVMVRLFDEDGELVVEGAASPGAADQYVADFPLDTVPSGVYLVRCSAADTAVPPLVGSSEVEVLIDHGPIIEAINPLPDSFLSLAGLHDFEVRIRPVPLFEGDDESALVGDPIISIDHQEFTLVPKGDEDPDVFIVEGVDFEDSELFPQVPEGATIVRVTAENERGIPGELEYNVAVDGNGPEVAVVQPTAGTIIGSRVTFTIQVTDDFSGVDWESLVVEAKDVPIPFDLSSSRWTQTNDVATLELNTEEYSVATQLSINVTVADMAGNVSSNGAGSTYFLDQQPPIFSLDPPNVRLRQEVSGILECSYSFDPAGPAAINHGEDSYNLVWFRALAWDVTNEEPGQDLFYYSSVDTSSIRLWVARAGEPLVVDIPPPGESVGDGICDGISSEADADVDAVTMIGLAATGNAFFGPTGDSADMSALPDMSGWCDYPANPAALPPDSLCGDDSDLTYAAGQYIGGTAVPAIYAPLVSGGAGCTGAQQSIAALLGEYEGWVCAAVTGQDMAGNASVSEPIAICLDSPEIAGAPSCTGQGAIAAPDCTDTCDPITLPADWGIIRPNWGG